MPGAASGKATTPAERPIQWLLVSDLDDTLTGDEPALARLLGVFDATPGLAVAINSSRPLASIEQTLAQFPGQWRPAAVIGAMGSQIRIGTEPLADWPPHFEGWDRAAVDRALSGLGFEAHADELQAPYKVSYTVPGEAQPRAIEAVQATGVAVEIVISGDSNFDVLPAGAGKAAAIRRLVRYFEIPLETGLIVAGDSANDLSMFELAKQGIVVANASDALRQAVAAEHAHFANAPRAAGVLEGLQAWGTVAGDA